MRPDQAVQGDDGADELEQDADDVDDRCEGHSSTSGAPRYRMKTRCPPIREVDRVLFGADRGYHRHVAQAVRSDPSGAEAAAGERYLFLADISGYTGFMSGVEEEHGVDFSDGIPAAYSVLGDLLDAVVEGVKPDLALVKLEGDERIAGLVRRAAIEGLAREAVGLFVVVMGGVLQAWGALIA